jgi:ATP-dependent RNA helicase DDX23/PRP28
MANHGWCILKEDFSIATKGGRIPNPIRSWEEAELPGKLLGIIEDL